MNSCSNILGYYETVKIYLGFVLHQCRYEVLLKQNSYFIDCEYCKNIQGKIKVMHMLVYYNRNFYKCCILRTFKTTIDSHILEYNRTIKQITLENLL